MGDLKQNQNSDYLSTVAAINWYCHCGLNVAHIIYNHGVIYFTPSGEKNKKADSQYLFWIFKAITNIGYSVSDWYSEVQILKYNELYKIYIF